MIAVTENVLTEMVEALVRAADPEAVYLFGSRARGEATEASDVDLLIVERESFAEGRSRVQEIARLRKALSSFRVPKDILVFSTEEFERWRGSLNHVVGRCLREGRLLYARP